MKILMPSTLRSRLALFNAVFLTGALLISLMLLYFTLDVWVNQQTDNSLIIMARQAEQGITLKDNVILYNRSITDNELEKQRQFMRVVNTNGEIQEHFGPLKELPVGITGVGSYSSKGSFQEIIKPQDDEVIRVYTLPIMFQGKIIGFVQTGQSLETAENMMQLLIITLFLLMPITLLFTLFGSRWITKKALSPLVDIADTAERISDRELHQRLAIPGNDEVARLAGSLDRMLDRLEEAFKGYHQFTGDASHELRTPLTVMKGEISLALQKERDNQYYQRTLEYLDMEVDRLTRMVEQLLTLARADGGCSQMQIRKINLRDTLVPIIEKAVFLAGTKNQQIIWQIPDKMDINTDSDTLQQIVFNVLDNAIKYSDENGKINLMVRTFANKIGIVISDSGKGIATEHLSRIFERFYRVDKGRSRDMGGTGLGLAIAKRLAKMLGGDLKADSTLGKGSTFEIDIPLETDR
ncbi:MAG: ATP-binding protein [Carboxydocellales bacterium]